MKLRYGIEYQNIESAKVVSIQIKIIMKRILLIIFKSLKQYTENDIEDVSFHFETLVLKNSSNVILFHILKNLKTII